MAQTADIITLNLRDTLVPGLIVYDVVQQKVGTVDRVDLDSGSFVVKTADIPHERLYLPIGLITNIDPRDLFVFLPILELYHDYTSPPGKDTHSAEHRPHPF